MSTQNPTYQWLITNGSPAIRMRTCKELLGQSPSQQMIDELMAFSMVQEWLNRLQPRTDFISLHGSKPECLENIGGKLHELGFDVSMAPEWAQRLGIFVEYLENIGKEKAIFDFSTLNIYASLIIIGFDHPLFLDMAVDHLTMVGDFCRQMDFNIYVDPNTFGGMYSQYKGRRLLNPEFNHRLPTIWDIYMLAYMPRTHHNKQIVEAQTAIINYILTDAYQSLPKGYGIMYHPPTKKYYAYGWNINLPGWFGINEKKIVHPAIFLQRLELMACFPEVQPRKWFQLGIQHLESFRTDQNTYRFPSAYLKEGTSGYYVTGSYMRLEENRRRKIAFELDCTFRMELIKHRISNP